MRTHNRRWLQTARPVLLALCLVLLCWLSACSDAWENSGNAQSEPLDRLLAGISSGSASVYESAFPPEFCRQYREQYADLDRTVTYLLTEANKRFIQQYGEGVQLRYELQAVRDCDFHSLPAKEQVLFSGLDEVRYTLSASNITAAAYLQATVHMIGDYERGQREVSLLVLCIDGQWYLHPQSFGEVFLKQA